MSMLNLAYSMSELTLSPVLSWSQVVNDVSPMKTKGKCMCVRARRAKQLGVTSVLTTRASAIVHK
eukprot:982560-Prorocentrum_lima.AAC.1